MSKFAKLVNWFQGRNTFMAVFFTIMGTVLQWNKKLDLNYIMLIGVVQALVLGHSIKEDYFAGKFPQPVAKVEAAVASAITPATPAAKEGEGDVK